MVLLDKNGDEVRVGDVVITKTTYPSVLEEPQTILYATKVLAIAGASIVIEDYIEKRTRLVFSKDCVLDPDCKGL
jgi:hypothetical protein